MLFPFQADAVYFTRFGTYPLVADQAPPLSCTPGPSHPVGFCFFLLFLPGRLCLPQKSMAVPRSIPRHQFFFFFFGFSLPTGLLLSVLMAFRPPPLPDPSALFPLPAAICMAGHEFFWGLPHTVFFSSILTPLTFPFSKILFC